MDWGSDEVVKRKYVRSRALAFFPSLIKFSLTLNDCILFRSTLDEKVHCSRLYWQFSYNEMLSNTMTYFEAAILIDNNCYYKYGFHFDSNQKAIPLFNYYVMWLHSNSKYWNYQRNYHTISLLRIQSDSFLLCFSSFLNRNWHSNAMRKLLVLHEQKTSDCGKKRKRRGRVRV